jgi:hypothetical protein
MACEIDRALAKIAIATVRASDELNHVRNIARVLPLPIRIQLNNAVEELDLLRFHLHEAAPMRAAVESRH